MNCAHRPRHRLALLAVGLLILLLGLFAVPRLLADEPWLVGLEDQPDRQQRCTAAQIVAMRQIELAGGVRYEGRMRCADGREFEFTQRQPHQRFEIRACDPAVC